ncbi:MAG: hypothetical protein OXR66_05630 [Candidatus Woesearchaeota archaeon]|nr:hypothetical protein [Candidatus Woesearchaeota archaeon]
MTTLQEALQKKHKILMLELPTEHYFHHNLATLRELTAPGIFISTQRPAANVTTHFKKENIHDVHIIDTTADQEHESCSCVTTDVDAIVGAINAQLNDETKFIFIDSLSTITLYKPLSEILRLSEFLITTANTSNATVLFGIAKDLKHKKFIEDIALQVDSIVNVQ